ncbi:membrane protein insertase YidC [Staphylococcus delphini]
MYKRKLKVLLLLTSVILSGCDDTKPKSENGFFYNSFASPMDQLLHWLGSAFNNNYGFAIIVIVLTVRFIMLPFMLAQSKNSHFMRKKMVIVKPELTKIQEQIKTANTQEEKIVANQELLRKYKEYGINPMKSTLGCLPLLIQMPILFGLYVSLKWPSSGGLTEHSDFLWFDLSNPDIRITVIAGVLYFIQSLVNLESIPKEQRYIGYIMTIISPLFIIYLSITSASALGLYWTVNAAFLIIQIFFSNKYYAKLAKHEANQLMKKLQGPPPR